MALPQYHFQTHENCRINAYCLHYRPLPAPPAGQYPNNAQEFFEMVMRILVIGATV